MPFATRTMPFATLALQVVPAPSAGWAAQSCGARGGAAEPTPRSLGRGLPAAPAEEPARRAQERPRGQKNNQTGGRPETKRVRRLTGGVALPALRGGVVRVHVRKF